MMDGLPPLDWATGNGQILTLEFRRLAAQLAATGPEPDTQRTETQIAVIEARIGGPSAVGRITRAFGLDPGARQTLLLAALADAPPALSGALQAHRLAAAGRATPAVIEALLGHTDTLHPDGALLGGHLLRIEGEARFHERPLIVPDAVRAALWGRATLDAGLNGRLRPLGPGAAPSAATEALGTLWRQACASPRPPTLFMAAGDLGAGLARFTSAVAIAGQAAWALPGSAIPGDPQDRAAFAGLLRRDLILNGIGLAILGQEAPEAAWDIAALLGLPCLVLGAAPPDSGLDSGPALRLPPTDPGETAWDVLLGTEAAAAAPIRALSQTIALSVPQVRRVVAATAAGLAPDLLSAARAEVGERLGHLAQRIQTPAAWDDLILPAPQQAALDQMAAFLGHRDRVLHDWGFAGKSGRGLGMAALFHGPSGTGKTTAAEALVGRMRDSTGDAVPLYRVNVAALVSKYIGETAKNFDAVFRAGEAMGAALLFDEADGLFGKRTGSVRDSIDKHSNAELGFLLQCLEAYPGIAILTTNMRSAIDDAFFRRFRFPSSSRFRTRICGGGSGRGSCPTRCPARGSTSTRWRDRRWRGAASGRRRSTRPIRRPPKGRCCGCGIWPMRSGSSFQSSRNPPPTKTSRGGSDGGRARHPHRRAQL
jgi:hypothetical protein